MTLTVHHLNNSRSQRVLFLLEELGIEYEIRRYERNPRTMLAPASLRQVHPLGKSPVITDGDLTIAESGAILEYLAATYGDATLRPPPDTEAGRRVTSLLHYAEGSLMPVMLVSLIASQMPRGAPALLRPLVRRVAGGLQGRFVGPRLALNLDFLESEMTGRPWFAGEHFTVADAQMSFPVEIAGQRQHLLGAARPKLQNWLDRIHARPAYGRALERGGPYEIGDLG